MKKLMGILIGLMLFFLTASSASASEGVVKLNAGAGFSGRCFAVSVFEEGMYRVLMTCRDLKVAYSAEGGFYVLWAENSEGKVYRLGEVERGKISTSVDQSFSKLFVTLEGDSYPRKASEQRVMEGMMEEIPFAAGGGSATQQPTEIKAQPTIKAVTPSPAPLIPDANQTSEGFSFGKVLGVMGRIIGLAILVLVVAGIVLTVVTRRKEQ